MSVLLHHPSLNATLRGCRTEVDGVSIASYKGIKFGTIPHRFAAAQIVDDWRGDLVDCTEYGPRCPQNNVDIGHLLRLPDNCAGGEKEVEDEFQCLNLVLCMPAPSPGDAKPTALLPVFIWIHGGSQVVTFASPASGCCDISRIVAEAVNMNAPIIIVSINYRLNIFAFGDGSGERNLALQDQRLAIEWVSKHIKGFGGDEQNITLGGESAGAVYAHAQMFMDDRIKRGILMSGSLYLSPPQPISKGEALIENLSQVTRALEGKSLKEASPSTLLQALQDTGTVSMWIQADAKLEGWDGKSENVESLLIGDVEYESVIRRNGIEEMTAEMINDCFTHNIDPQEGYALHHIYGVDPTRPTACKLGALDFINDVRFAMPADDIASRWWESQRHVFQYVIDQANPWQTSSRAHHGVDLVMLFGGYDLSFIAPAEAVGKEMRRKWIAFVNGWAPWPEDRRYAFGPYGKSAEIDHHEYAARRRVKHFGLLRDVGQDQVGQVFAKLAAGRLSLNN